MGTADTKPYESGEWEYVGERDDAAQGLESNFEDSGSFSLHLDDKKGIIAMK